MKAVKVINEELSQFKKIGSYYRFSPYNQMALSDGCFHIASKNLMWVFYLVSSFQCLSKIENQKNDVIV
jgi:hypothetical protein